MEPNAYSFLEKIASKAIEQGFVDPESVTSMTKHYDAHALVCQDKADLLFTINAGVRTSQQNCPAWNQLFAQAICRFVVFDLNSPGEIAESESQWLLQQLSNLEELTESEICLLKEIQENAISVTPAVRELVDRVKMVENQLTDPK
jgi:hypothetical protein